MYNTNRTSINLFKVGSRNTGKWFEICSKLVIKTPKQHQWHRSDVFIVTFEYISHLFNIFQVFLTPPPLWTGLRASVGKYFFQTESWNLTWRDLIDFDTDHNKTWLNFVLLDDLPGCKTIHIANCSQFFTIFQHILPCSCMKIMGRGIERRPFCTIFGSFHPLVFANGVHMAWNSQKSYFLMGSTWYGIYSWS